jgi:hypothetical protein
MYGSGMMPGAMPGVMGYGPGIGGPMMAGAPGTTTTTTVTTMWSMNPLSNLITVEVLSSRTLYTFVEYNETLDVSWGVILFDLYEQVLKSTKNISTIV